MKDSPDVWAHWNCSTFLIGTPGTNQHPDLLELNRRRIFNKLMELKCSQWKIHRESCSVDNYLTPWTLIHHHWRTKLQLRQASDSGPITVEERWIQCNTRAATTCWRWNTTNLDENFHSKTMRSLSMTRGGQDWCLHRAKPQKRLRYETNVTWITCYTSADSCIWVNVWEVAPVSVLSVRCISYSNQIILLHAGKVEHAHRRKQPSEYGNNYTNGS